MVELKEAMKIRALLKRFRQEETLVEQVEDKDPERLAVLLPYIPTIQISHPLHAPIARSTSYHSSYLVTCGSTREVACLEDKDTWSSRSGPGPPKRSWN